MFNSASNPVKTLLILIALVLSGQVFAGVREDINKAKILYERGKLQQASKILQRIISQYPDNKAAHYLLGRMYFKAGQPRIAARYFKKSGSNFIDGATAFEYGISMFAANDCARAVRGFSKVGVDAHKDLANFYAGVCYYKMRNYFAAERAMRRAKRIPSSFASTRRRVLLDISKRNREERQGRVARSAPYVPLPVAPGQQAYTQAPYYQNPYQPGLPPGAGAPELENSEDVVQEKKPEPPPKPVQGFAFGLTPRVEYYSETVTSDRHGRGQKTVTKQGPQGGAEVRGMYHFAPNKHGDQTTFTVPLDVNVQSLEKSTKNVKYTDEGGEIVTSATETKVADKSLNYTLKPGLAIPVTESFDIEGGGHYGETLPDFKTDLKETEMGGFANLSLGIGDDVNVKGSGTLLEKEKLNETKDEVLTTSDQTFTLNLDAGLPWDLALNLTATFAMTSNPLYESLDGYSGTQTFGGGLKKNWETFSLGTTVTQSTNEQPNTGPISGTADQMKIVADATKNFKVGLNFRIFGSYTMVNQYVKTGLCPTGSDGAIEPCDDATQTAEATGSRTGYGLDVKFTPVEWAYAKATYSIEESVYAVKQADLVADFQDQVTDYSSSLSILIGLSTSF